LANVRTSPGYEVIKDPIGLPDDLSQEILEMHKAGALDWHSATWYYLDELLNYNWSQTRVEEVNVTGEGFQEFIETGHPTSWTRSSNTVFDLSKVKKAWDNYINKRPIEGVCIRLERSGVDRFSHFFLNILGPLKKASKKYGGPKNIRLVMWFDN
jgi:hypothetical protein